MASDGNFRIDFHHPANAGVLASLNSRHPHVEESEAEASPDDFINPYERLGTHPGVVARLWNEVAIDLPEDCRWIVYRRPILVHPRTGLIFGVASGTPTYALRLPERERSEALRLGAKTVWTYNDAWTKGLGPEHNTHLNLADWGPGWTFGKWLPEECRWCLAAYHLAAEGH